MHPDMIWGNDEKYTKEFQIKFREEQQKKHNELMERLAKEDEERKKQEQLKRAALAEQTNTTEYRITNVFVRQYLEAKITAARWALALGIVMTALFKGQWVMWILFIVLYNLYVKQAKKDAEEADRRGIGGRKR